MFVFRCVPTFKMLIRKTVYAEKHSGLTPKKKRVCITSTEIDVDNIILSVAEWSNPNGSHNTPYTPCKMLTVPFCV